MISGQRFYLDLQDKTLIKDLELVITYNGGRVERFLSKDISCVVTSRTPQPINQQNQASKASPVPLSRGKALLMQSRRIASENCSKDPIQFAHNWGIPWVLVQEFINTYKLQMPHPSYRGDAKQMKLRQRYNSLNVMQRLSQGPCLKFEDTEHQYRPHIQCYQTFPNIIDVHKLPQDDLSRSQYADLMQMQAKKDNVLRNLPACSNGAQSVRNMKIQETVDSQKRNVIKGDKNQQPTGKTIYCECCEIYFTNLKEHSRCMTHMAFASNKENFSHLDGLIAKLPSINDLIDKLSAAPQNSSISASCEVLPFHQSVQCEKPVPPKKPIVAAFPSCHPEVDLNHVQPAQTHGFKSLSFNASNQPTKGPVITSYMSEPKSTFTNHLHLNQDHTRVYSHESQSVTSTTSRQMISNHSVPYCTYACQTPVAPPDCFDMGKFLEELHLDEEKPRDLGIQSPSFEASNTEASLLQRTQSLYSNSLPTGLARHNENDKLSAYVSSPSGSWDININRVCDRALKMLDVPTIASPSSSISTPVTSQSKPCSSSAVACASNMETLGNPASCDQPYFHLGSAHQASCSLSSLPDFGIIDVHRSTNDTPLNTLDNNEGSYMTLNTPPHDSYLSEQVSWMENSNSNMSVSQSRYKAIFESSIKDKNSHISYSQQGSQGANCDDIFKFEIHDLFPIPKVCVDDESTHVSNQETHEGPLSQFKEKDVECPENEMVEKTEISPDMKVLPAAKDSTKGDISASRCDSGHGASLLDPSSKNTRLGPNGLCESSPSVNSCSEVDVISYSPIKDGLTICDGLKLQGNVDCESSDDDSKGEWQIIRVYNDGMKVCLRRVMSTANSPPGTAWQTRKPDECGASLSSEKLQDTQPQPYTCQRQLLKVT